MSDASTAHSDFAELLNAAISDGAEFAESATTALTRYLRDHDGAHFDTYGIAAGEEDRIGPADLVAVTCLSMEIRRNSRAGFTPHHAVVIDELGPAITALLSTIPAGLDLHELSDADFDRWVGPGSPADRLWTLLRTQVGTPPVATFKLLARKRPRLLPISDSVVAAALGDPERWWEPWWRALRHHPGIVERLRSLRDTAGAGEVSLLRVADIVIWTRYHSG